MSLRTDATLLFPKLDVDESSVPSRDFDIGGKPLVIDWPRRLNTLAPRIETPLPLPEPTPLPVQRATPVHEPGDVFQKVR
jgi:hypothetical protein